MGGFDQEMYYVEHRVRGEDLRVSFAIYKKKSYTKKRESNEKITYTLSLSFPSRHRSLFVRTHTRVLSPSLFSLVFRLSSTLAMNEGDRDGEKNIREAKRCSVSLVQLIFVGNIR